MVGMDELRAITKMAKRRYWENKKRKEKEGRFMCIVCGKRTDKFLDPCSYCGKKWKVST